MTDPVAWVAFAPDGSESSAVYRTQEEARAAADDFNWCIAPLYRSPDCPHVTGTVTRYCTLTPFTLTDAEREAIEEAIRRLWGFHNAATLRGLLERMRAE